MEKASRKLTYVSDEQLSIRRVRHGSGFSYLSSAGKAIKDNRTLDRIRKLAIPPAYTDVRICSNPHGHIQAVGRDARGRKQYRYHDAWRARRDAAKFGRMVEFGLALPRLRKHLKQVLRHRGFPRDKVIAVIVELLDRTRARIGNEEYVRSNKSFGLTTLRNRHVKFLREGSALLRFKGKSGIVHEIKINDHRLADIVHKLQELSGQHLFQYLDDNGKQHSINSSMVNEYLHAIMGQEFTAKDFRTWNATLRAIELLRHMPLPSPLSDRASKRNITAVINRIADELRNTPAVCRKSYINPAVFIAWKAGKISADTMSKTRSREKAAIHLLKTISG